MAPPVIRLGRRQPLNFVFQAHTPLLGAKAFSLTDDQREGLKVSYDP